ncbi:PP2C family protein-serine/threonine phosphatase [Kitasatospora sp. NPDC059571]|uniref:PP2C family protein-serine/threonine phosphatase n=1 Tax=Kitasatospora sp. NPDC059571 TaxID=3346871 RepID=UPI00367F6558
MDQPPTGPEGVVDLAATVARLAHEMDDLRRESAGRPLLAVAAGVIAERLGCSPSAAAARIAALAEQAGSSPAAFAAEIVAAATARDRASTGRPTTPGAPQAARADAPLPGLDALARAALDPAAVGDACAVAIWTREPGGALALAGQAGFPASDVLGWRRVPPGIGTPARLALASGADAWPPDGPAAPAAPTIGGTEAPVRLVLPIRRAGDTMGAVEIAWQITPADLPANFRARMQALAEICALTLDLGGEAGRQRPTTDPSADDATVTALDGALGSAMLLTAVTDPNGRVADFRIAALSPGYTDPVGRPAAQVTGRTFLEAYPLAGGGLLERLRRTHATGEPIRGERLHLALHAGQRPLVATVRLSAARTATGLLVSWQREDGDDRETALLRTAQRLTRIGGFEEDLATGTVHWTGRLFELYGLSVDDAPVPLSDLVSHVHPDDREAVRDMLHGLLRRRTSVSAVCRVRRPDGAVRYARVVAEPVLDANGRPVGIVGAYQDVSAHHRTEVALAATRDRLADREQVAAEQARLALRLQQAILPTGPPPLDAADLTAAVRYRPAALQEKVGGDWYDALPLDGGRALLAVGDVAGHGIEAATSMIVLRNALRGLAMTGAGPARLLAWLNMTTLQLREPTTATAVCAGWESTRGELRWARAGHFPPALLRPAGPPELLPLPSGLLLGASEDAVYEEHRLHPEPGAVLLLCTDGLVERRDRDVTASLEELLRAVGPPGEDLEAYLDRLLAQSPADTGDDTCLVAVRMGR